MSVLILFRHGQASVLHGKYDQLSDLGEKQSHLLGEFWAEQEVLIDQVFVGPRKRHEQTQHHFSLAYKERGLPWPEPICINELDEYPAIRMVRKHILSDWIRENGLEHSTPDQINQALSKSQAFSESFREMMRSWVRGELDDPEFERWHAFRERVESGVEKMSAEAKPGKVIAAFTSAGTVAAASGKALGVEDEKILEMSWIIRNATYTDFIFDQERFSLRTFNASPFIHHPEYLTYY